VDTIGVYTVRAFQQPLAVCLARAALHARRSRQEVRTWRLALGGISPSHNSVRTLGPVAGPKGVAIRSFRVRRTKLQRVPGVFPDHGIPSVKPAALLLYACNHGRYVTPVPCGIMDACRPTCPAASVSNRTYRLHAIFQPKVHNASTTTSRGPQHLPNALCKAIRLHPSQGRMASLSRRSTCPALAPGRPQTAHH
jgi:hypothetical protein